MAALFLAGCSLAASTNPEPAAQAADSQPTETGLIAADLPNFGQAPELHEGAWLNSEQPLQLANLRGKVVLLEMWTYS